MTKLIPALKLHGLAYLTIVQLARCNALLKLTTNEFIQQEKDKTMSDLDDNYDEDYIKP